MSVQIIITNDADMKAVEDIFHEYGIDFRVGPAPAQEVVAQTVPVPMLDPELVGRLERVASSLTLTLDRETITKLHNAAGALSSTLSDDKLYKLTIAATNLGTATERMGGRY